MSRLYTADNSKSDWEQSLEQEQQNLRQHLDNVMQKLTVTEHEFALAGAVTDQEACCERLGSMRSARIDAPLEASCGTSTHCFSGGGSVSLRCPPHVPNTAGKAPVALAGAAVGLSVQASPRLAVKMSPSRSAAEERAHVCERRHACNSHGKAVCSASGRADAQSVSIFMPQPQSGSRRSGASWSPPRQQLLGLSASLPTARQTIAPRVGRSRDANEPARAQGHTMQLRMQPSSPPVPRERLSEHNCDASPDRQLSSATLHAGRVAPAGPQNTARPWQVPMGLSRAASVSLPAAPPRGARWVESTAPVRR